jgi:hypothetical protein
MAEGRIHLLLDCDAFHRTEALKQAARELGITLHFIPQVWLMSSSPSTELSAACGKLKRNTSFTQDVI